LLLLIALQNRSTEALCQKRPMSTTRVSRECHNGLPTVHTAIVIQADGSRMRGEPEINAMVDAKGRLRLVGFLV
jgi:hypothetical protein